MSSIPTAIQMTKTGEVETLKVVAENPSPINSRGNPYLEGMHEPIRQEIDIPALEVIGRAPMPRRISSGFYACCPPGDLLI